MNSRFLIGHWRRGHCSDVSDKENDRVRRATPAAKRADATPMQPMDAAEIHLVYDRECPVCEAYCRMVRIREAAGVLRLVNARDAGEIMDEITAKGLDIDEGMVLKVGNTVYYGADAIHLLSLISSRSGVFNRLTYWFFRSKGLSAVIYPLFRFFRNLLLKLLRKSRINNLGLPRREKF
jgi:predicted DCC family thiol-disulfide oxidoreductase YuxK